MSLSVWPSNTSDFGAENCVLILNQGYFENVPKLNPGTCILFKKFNAGMKKFCVITLALVVSLGFDSKSRVSNNICY